MTLATLLKCAERLLTRRPPKLIAGSFFSLAMIIILASYFAKDGARDLFLRLLAAFGVSLGALGLRWVEKKCPDPRNDSRVTK